MQSGKGNSFKDYVQRQVFINKSLQAQKIPAKLKCNATDELLKNS